jgi:hypothetical protein
MTEIEVTSAPVLPPVGAVAVKLAVPVATVLSALVKRAVMVAVPGPTAVASPEVLIVATWTLLELQETWLPTFSVTPDKVVPMAMNWVWSPSASDRVPGMTEIDVTSTPELPPVDTVTVRLAVPVATVLSAFVKRAVIVAVPGLTAVASPVEELMLTIPELLELQRISGESVTFSVDPDGVVPIAMNWAVSFDGTD